MGQPLMPFQPTARLLHMLTLATRVATSWLLLVLADMLIIIIITGWRILGEGEDGHSLPGLSRALCVKQSTNQPPLIIITPLREITT